MLKIKKILLPLDLHETALPAAVIHQADFLAHHFHAKILLLHVVNSSFMVGSNVAHCGNRADNGFLPRFPSVLEALFLLKYGAQV
jgi:hypothetical protein